MEVLLLIVSGLIIIVGLLQESNTDGVASAFTGAKDLSLFSVKKDRGAEKVLVNTTYILGILFFGLVILINIM